ncbi:MAG TPA: phosphoribosylamine--glycine ligase [Gemmatimonadaceae bacterium]|nr:phosphoribosylamine--glycine ligase [Gemmatimonadaceae bacterium]
MKVLIVGGGGREHAIAWKLKRDDPSLDLHCAPGNPGIASLATCHDIQSTNLDGLVTLGIWERFDFTIVGPEGPLAAGLVDRLMSRGYRAFGPTGAAAHIESSKRFAKEIMMRAHVPTARATWHNDVTSAKAAAREAGAPVVIKASGLAAGKGVMVCQTIEAADRAIDEMLTAHRFGRSGDEILVEEFMEGEELSIFFLTDGESSRAMIAAQDHKRLLDGDEGPNTGGMGAYAPVSLATRDLMQLVQTSIIQPTLAAMRDVGVPFRGLLYCGLMLTESGPKVVEFNCRFGDPESQVVLPLMKSALLPYLVACTTDGGLADTNEIEFLPDAAVTTVVAATGYPESPRTGDPIDLSTVPDDAIVFHAGTTQTSDGTLQTAGGRVFAVTGVAATFAEAQERSRYGAEQVRFADRVLRRDIGWRENSRRAGVT